MMLGDIGPFEILRGNPTRLRIRGDINTTEVTTANLLPYAEWIIAVIRQLHKAEMEATQAKLTDSKN